MSTKNDTNLNLIPVSEIKPASLDMEAVRSKLENATGPRYWRTLEELADHKAFGELLEREFPRGASEWLDPVTRRGFLKLAGASLALAGLTGCTKQPPEQILPYVRQPEDLILGKPFFYATAMPFAGHGIPLLAESHEYRPTKLEGNPDHGASLGSSDLFAQASILDLYDPDRSTTITYLGEGQSWGIFVGAMRDQVQVQHSKQGAGLRFLTGAVSSPTLGSQMKAVLQQYPQAKWHRYEPVHRDSQRQASKAALGGNYDPIYNFAAADVVVSLDADFLSGSWFPGFLRYSRDFMSRRKQPNEQMNRLYVAECSPSTTGMKADHRMAVRPSELEKVARALAAKIGVAGSGGEQLTAEQAKWVDAAAKDLISRRGKSLVVPGIYQSAAVQALAYAMNSQLGSTGQTVNYIDAVEVDPIEHTQSIRELVADMNAGKVELLVMMGVNPVYETPVDLEFEKALEKVGLKVQISSHRNETTGFCQWHVPGTHYLESWSDVRSYDGTATIIQPLIQPLYDGRSMHEIVAIFNEQPASSSYDSVRAYWQSQHTGGDFEAWWRRSIHDGYVAGSAFPLRQLSAKAGGVPAAAASSGEIEIIFRPDPCIYDGRFVNNGWLQETPKPLTRVTWDNVAMISPAMASRMKLDQLNDHNDHQSDAQNVLEFEIDGRKVSAPYWPQPGHPDNAVTLFLGYGQTKSGRVGTGAGYNAYSVRTSAAPYVVQAAAPKLLKQYWNLAVTQGHFTMENREPVKAATLEEYRKDPLYAKKDSETGEIEGPRDKDGQPESLYYDYRSPDTNWYKRYAWGMAIDLNSCIGCQACAVACQAENNISVVGKEQVQRGREMQWIRIDAYYEGDPANPQVHFQPVPCMQCENAPCEPVCPVGATVHSTEGLNDMVYNRCVGTRYCSNNCPYKVRRFNFFLYADYDTPSLKMMRNPDVTVRSRGVMEKCTYCIQRINAARINSEEQDREIKDGEIITACQQACPTEAIIFGNINDKNSRVAKLKTDSRNYSLLAELNTRPRTTYIGAVRNPNPELEPAKNESGEKA
jgi:molybdopterin-containing oxidoreductase family iron-sulfur binding subunit